MSSPVDTRAPADSASPARTFSGALARTAGVQKTSKGAPAYSRFVNRRLGRYLAAAAYATGRTPNQVTFVSACFSYGAIVVIALVRPSVLIGLVVALGLVVGYALDSADGQLARLRGGGRPVGEWLDHMVDCVKISALHIAVLVSFYRYFPLHHHVALLLIPIAFEAVAAIFFFGTILTDQLRRTNKQNLAARSDVEESAVAPAAEPASLVRSLLVLPTDYGLMCVIFVGFGWLNAFEILYSFLLAGTVLFVFAVTLKWYREISAFAPAPGK